MQISSQEPKSNSNLSVMALIFLGFLVMIFAFGKSIIDVFVLPPRTLDLAVDDQIETGFLPVYIAEGASANPAVVAVQVEGLPIVPTPQPEQEEVARDPGLVPDRIHIPVIGLEATVIPIGYEKLQFEGQIYDQWLAPDYRAVGWHETSAGLGAPGNSVLNGHHNIYGEVFRDLYRVQVGDEIRVVSGDREFRYVAVYTSVVPERNQPLEVRLANAEWIQATEDERITLITCWPYESNTHRVVVVAVPLRDSSG
ncbi:MAG: sortase [Anaerolineales bacterium]|nr:sortase [Anaerolineales bacterium]